MLFIRKLFSSILTPIGWLLLMGITSCGVQAGQQMSGESFVLVNEIPAKIMGGAVLKGSVKLRSTYSDTGNGIYYKEGKDFVIDYRNGTIKRTPGSRIPDYANHPMYGKGTFDERKFGDYANWSNEKYFVYLDYRSRYNAPVASLNDQSAFLKHTRDKLQIGTPITLIWYGNSITAGGGASDPGLFFTNRYEQFLKEKFPAAQIQSVNLSIPGYGSPEGLSWFNDKFKGIHPDIVFIGFGMNDQCDEGTAACEPNVFKHNLITIANLIKSRYSADVVFFSTFPPNENWIHNTHRMFQYAEASRQAAKETGSAYADVYGAWQQILKIKDQQSLLANNINHPNDFGHWIYEQAFEAMLF